MKFWLNLIGYQLVWFAAVIGAEHGVVWPGVPGMLLFAGSQLALSGHRRADLALMAVALVLGFVMDGGMIRAGFATYAAAWPSGGLAPAWILALWISFSLTFTQSLAYLQKRLWIALLFGGIGGPLAYLSAARGFHVVTFAAPQWHGLLWLSVSWAIAAPLLAWLARRWTGAAAAAPSPDLHGVTS